MAKAQTVSQELEKFRQFASGPHVETVLYALASIMNVPESFKRDTEFDTVYTVAMFDGEKALLERFKTLVNDALDGNADKLSVLNR